MILLIDNYDSFSYNLFQAFGEFEEDIVVIRNNELSIEEIEALNPEAIVISPGPGKPEDSGVCIEVIKKLGKNHPILGVCLGHQAICQAFGATITYANKLMHGKSSEIEIYDHSKLFKDLPNNMEVARYHSLSAVENTIPNCLLVTSKSDDGEVMSVEHKDYDIYGLQFHPESIMTKFGSKIIENFLEIAKSR